MGAVRRAGFFKTFVPFIPCLLLWTAYGAWALYLRCRFYTPALAVVQRERDEEQAHMTVIPEGVKRQLVPKAEACNRFFQLCVPRSPHTRRHAMLVLTRVHVCSFILCRCLIGLNELIFVSRDQVRDLWTTHGWSARVRSPSRYFDVVSTSPRPARAMVGGCVIRGRQSCGV